MFVSKNVYSATLTEAKFTFEKSQYSKWRLWKFPVLILELYSKIHSSESSKEFVELKWKYYQLLKEFVDFVG